MKKVIEDPTSRGFSRPFEWLNLKLMPILGPPPLGPWEDTGSSRVTCPVCGELMAAHTIDRSSRNAVLLCPAPHRTDWERDPDAPLNEVGMPRR